MGWKLRKPWGWVCFQLKCLQKMELKMAEQFISWGSDIFLPTKQSSGNFVVLESGMGGHCARRSLRTPWKLGLRIVAWWKLRMFCEESFGKIKFFSETCRSTNSIAWKRWLPWSKWTLLSGRRKIRIWISKIVMVGCCKLSLYANESWDERAICFRRWLKRHAM